MGTPGHARPSATTRPDPNATTVAPTSRAPNTITTGREPYTAYLTRPHSFIHADRHSQ
jgi:hypothetical protein